MRPSFNTAGPCIPGEHYMLPPERRLVTWKDERHVIEVKLRRGPTSGARGRAQLARYLDHLGLAEGWLVLFDRRRKKLWKDKLFVREVQHAGKRIRVVASPVPPTYETFR